MAKLRRMLHLIASFYQGIGTNTPTTTDTEGPVIIQLPRDPSQMGGLAHEIYGDMSAWKRIGCKFPFAFIYLYYQPIHVWSTSSLFSLRLEYPAKINA